MDIKISAKQRGIIGICGHAGMGHAHSHSGFVQDDSGGLAVVGFILKKALPANTTISSVEADIDKGIITVTTADGGVGRAWARRGITPVEAELMKRAVGLDALLSQAVAVYAFGRIYGQGIMEVPVALQGAVAQAAINTFASKWPGYVMTVDEDIPSNRGRIMGTVVEIAGIPVALLAVANCSHGGIGPNEDLEGNIMLGAKGALMADLGLDAIPTIVVEGKVYVPGICSSLEHSTFWVRANKEVDNRVVADCLCRAAEESGMPYIFSDNVLHRNRPDFIEACKQFGLRIADLGNRFKEAGTSQEKIEIIGELAILVSQDAGGYTFMSNSLQQVAGSAGMMPGTSAVISLLVDSKYIRHWKIPMLTIGDIEKYFDIIINGCINLKERLNEARKEIIQRFDFNREEFTCLVDKQ